MSIYSISLNHSCHLKEVKFAHNKGFNYAAIGYKDIDDGAVDKFNWEIKKLEREKQERWERSCNKRLGGRSHM